MSTKRKMSGYYESCCICGRTDTVGNLCSVIDNYGRVCYFHKYCMDAESANARKMRELKAKREQQ